MRAVSSRDERQLALEQAFRQRLPETCAAFRPWTYDVPLAIRPETHLRMERIQQLYLKCIRHFAVHYLDRYQVLMPLPERALEILTICRERPYRPGSYRTDFVVGVDDSIHLIETTCRFAMNGYFKAGVFAQLAREYAESRPGLRWVEPHATFLEDFLGYFRSFDRVSVLLGWNTAKNESAFIAPVLEAADVHIEWIDAADVPSSTHLLRDDAVIGELSHEELFALPLETIEAIVDADLLNDLRTVLLVHDKRFFAVLQRDEFMQHALTQDERAELQPYLAPTFTRDLSPERWDEARRGKDRWIIKPFNNGMSIDVFAGPLTSQADWADLFDSGRADAMVLQEYIPQRTFPGTIDGIAYEDYAAGTLLCFEDRFYGTGLFRASSHPVTNKGDDRKIAPLVTPDVERFDSRNIL
jgi:hypothetical protein